MITLRWRTLFRAVLTMVVTSSFIIFSPTSAFATSCATSATTFTGTSASATYGLANGQVYQEVKITAAGSCSWTVPNNVSAVSVLMVAGGGGGGFGNLGGGGGAGEVLVSNSAISVTPNSLINVTVGSGGNATNGGGGNYSSSPTNQSYWGYGGNGGNTVFGSYTALGGGGGGGSGTTTGNNRDTGASGGSGGGADQGSATNAAGCLPSSGSPCTSYSGFTLFGNAGGAGSSGYGGGGGGGAGGAGDAGNDSQTSNGGGLGGVGKTIFDFSGAGGGEGWYGAVTSAVTTNFTTYGAGVSRDNSASFVCPTVNSVANACNATSNTGSGGGGGGAGASGIIEIFYQYIPTLTTPSAPNVSNYSSVSIAVSESAATPNASSYIVNVFGSDGTTFVESSTVTTASITYAVNYLSGLTPNTTYKVSVTAVGDGLNYMNSSASSQTSITLGLGPTGVTLSLTGTPVQFQHTGSTTITATLTGGAGAGVVTFYYNNKKIFRCVGISTAGTSAVCTWKPSAHGTVFLTASYSPTNSNYSASTSAPYQVFVGSRTLTHGA
jgi:hypothetical protein